MRATLLAWLALGGWSGCARGTFSGGNPGDGSNRGDANDDPTDAAPDAPPDAPPDACIPAVTELLANPAFDLAPEATGWIEQRITQQFPLVTGNGALAEHSAPFKAWLGGLEGGADALYQDLAVPPLTRQLVIAGFHDVRTSEDGDANQAFDTGSLSVTQPSGTPIVAVLILSNLTPKTGWTAFSHTFTQDLSGQTVRVRMATASDSSLPTSFYFDTLSLTATHGCP